MRSEPPVRCFFPVPASDYPLRAGPAEPLARRDRLWLAALLLLTLLPRIAVAVRLGPLCDDGYFYLAVAEAYERGDLRTALWYLNVNIYPVLLAAFGGFGAEPVAAAKAWGVAVATLTVLPLFGWLRRLLDRRAAFAACVLYALHPEFIELSPEPIRDPTFWFLAASSLYLLWRAAAERSLPLFVAAGSAVALAAHTRSEGWLLALPATAWPLVRWREAAGERWKLLVGSIAAFAMIPLLLVAVNVTILRDHGRWEWGKLEHFRLAYSWATGAGPAETPPQVRTAPAVAAPPAPPVPIRPDGFRDSAPMLAERLGREAADGEMSPQDTRRREAGISSYLSSAARALEPVPLLLMLAGAIVGRRLLVRREHLVLSAICVAVMLGVWARQTTLGEINGRYFLACFFPASGAAGLGALWVLSRLEQAWMTRLPRSRAAVATAGIAAVIGGTHVADAVAADHPSRDRDAAVGRLLGDRFGGDRSLIVLPRACRVGYYACGQMPVVLLDDTPIESLVTRHAAEVVLLEHDDTPASRCADIARRLTAQGWRPHELPGIPGADHLVVLTSPSSCPATAASLRPARPHVR